MYIKNIDSINHIYAGQTIVAGGFYQIQSFEQNNFANDANLLIDICTNKAQVSELGNDSGLISDINEQINALKKLSLMKTQEILAQDGLTSRPFGFNFVATKGTQTTHNEKLVESLSIRGGTLETENCVFGDEFSVKVVDVDNVLGFGAGFVLYDFIKNWQCHKDGFNELREETITQPIPANVYFQVEYNSTGALDDVSVAMNLFGYKA